MASTVWVWSPSSLVLHEVQSPIATPHPPCSLSLIPSRRTSRWPTNVRAQASKPYGGFGKELRPDAAPVSPLDVLYNIRRSLNDIERLIQSTETNPGWGRASWEFRDESKEIKLRVDVPGQSKEDLTVWCDHEGLKILTATGSRGDLPIGESLFLRLPESCKKEGMHYHVDNGVLFVSVPKTRRRGEQDVQILD